MLCPVCNKDYTWQSNHFKTEDKEHINYINKLYPIIDNYLLNTDVYLKDIPNCIKEKEGLVCWSSLVYKRKDEICPTRGYEVMAKRRMGDNNPVFQDGVIEKISNTVAQEWESGVYDNRINGMTGKCGANSPNFNLNTFLKCRFSPIYHYFHINKKCLFEGCDKDFKNTHHIDEDHSNFLITNLEGYCVYHHMTKHYKHSIQPMTTITKEFRFESSHHLINDYQGKCSNNHGHSYKLLVSIKKRVNPTNDMVLDFGDLKEIVNKSVIDKLDHRNLNEVMDINPTAERMLLWIWRVLEQDALLKGLHELKLWETQGSFATLNYKDVLNCSGYIWTYYNAMKDLYHWEQKE